MITKSIVAIPKSRAQTVDARPVKVNENNWVTPVLGMVLICLFACAMSLLPVPANAAQAKPLTIFANSATSGPDLVHEINIQGTMGTLVKNTTVSSGNGRGVVVVGNIIYSTESGPSGNIFGGSNIIYKTDRTTGAALGTITVSGLPSGAAMSTLAWDGTHFWTSEYLGGNHAYRIDIDGKIVKTIVLSLASSNMDGMEYFNGKLICNRGDNMGPYDVYDLDGNVLQASFISSRNGTGIAFDGTNFYTSNFSSLSVWDGVTGAHLYDVSLSGGNFNIEDLSVDYATRGDTGGGEITYEPGPVGNYFITAGQQGMTSVAKGDAIISSWVNHFPQSPGQYAISVLDKVRLMGSFFEGVETTYGSEYRLDGVYTGKDFKLAIPSAGFWDGATDGTSNYSVDYEKGGVYKFGLNWADPAFVFDTEKHYLGITFDVGSSRPQTFWLAQWDNGVVENRSLDGTKLSSFEVPFNHISCLAIDPADGSLWMGSQGTLGTFYHYSPKGKQINTRVYDSLKNQNTLGGEFPLPLASQPPQPASSTPPTVTISVFDESTKKPTSSTSVKEGGVATFTITRSAVSPKSLLVMYYMALFSSAEMGSDYTLSTVNGKPGRNATIPANETSTKIILHALADGGPRPESATMMLDKTASYKVGSPNKATVTINKATSPGHAQ